MNADVRQVLAEHGIDLRRYQPGNHRAPCPWCRKGKGDTALAVKIDHDGVCWHCHRCGEKGGCRANGSIDPFDGTSNSSTSRKSASGAAIDAPVPERYETLSSWGRTLWENARPIEPDCIAGRYLTERGCAPPPFPDETHLRWHPALSDRVSGYTSPALVALVTDVETGEPINLHRTWLRHDGAGKAPIETPRRLLKGHPARGVIRLWPDAEIIMGLVIGEGIETCLAAARAGFAPVWAAMTAGNLKAFPVLPGPDGLTVLVDHDKPNPHTGIRPGHDAALAVVERYGAAGFDPKHDLRIILPPTEGQDAADLEPSA